MLAAGRPSVRLAELLILSLAVNLGRSVGPPSGTLQATGQRRSLARSFGALLPPSVCGQVISKQITPIRLAGWMAIYYF